MSEPEIILPVPALPAPKPKRQYKLHPAMEARKWKPGQSGNPNGQRTAVYLEAMAICRAKSPEAAHKMVELMHSDDHRVAYMAASAILERAWGKPREYDPTADPQNKPHINAANLTPEERNQLRTLIQAATQIAEQS